MRSELWIESPFERQPLPKFQALHHRGVMVGLRGHLLELRDALGEELSGDACHETSWRHTRLLIRLWPLRAIHLTQPKDPLGRCSLSERGP